jgi:hypothetical protein
MYSSPAAKERWETMWRSYTGVWVTQFYIELMSIYDLKTRCLACLEEVMKCKYTGPLAEALKAFQSGYEARRWWVMEASMVTEAGIQAWVSQLDTDYTKFTKDSEPTRDVTVV